MKGIFICIIGIDGSGKSTLATSFINEMRSKGNGFNYVWSGCKHYISFPIVFLGKKLFFRGIDRTNDYYQFQEQIHKTAKIGAISKIYHKFVLLDYFSQIFLKIQIPLIIDKDNIISDRYVYDVFINLAINLGYDLNLTKNYLKSFLYICPKPDLVFLIDIPEEVAFHRKSDIPSIDYLNVRRDYYLSIAKEYGMVILDGTKDKDELTEFIIKIVENNFGSI